MKQLVLNYPKTLSLLLSLLFSLSTLNSLANESKLFVTVVDEDETPLSGVNVFTSDLNFTAVTDEEGKVVVGPMNSLKEINFSYIGYETIKVPFYHLRYIEAKVKMRPEFEIITPIIVVGRRDDHPANIPYAIEKINQEEIAFSQAQNAADVLQQNGNIFVQKSQMGGGSPVIRGFEANRVLLVVDGVRLNNAIYRSGHLQNAITIDQSMLEQAEIIYGPGSLMYGSDALGGVVHYRTKDPKINRAGLEPLIRGNYFSRYASANQEKTGHFDISISGKTLATLTSLNYSNFGDLRSGNRRPAAYPDFGKHLFYINNIDGQDVLTANSKPSIQRNTGYSQIDFMHKIRYQPNSNLFFVANFQYSNSSSINRFDQLSIPNDNSLKFAEWYYGPQSRSLLSLKTRLLKSNVFYDKATLIAAAQKIGEDRHQRKTNDPWRNSTLVDVAVFSFTADFDKYINKKRKHHLSYGFDLNHNNVNALGLRYNIDEGSVLNDISSRYPSQGSSLSSMGTYVNYRWRNSDSTLIYNAGVRYTYNNISARFGADDPIEWPLNYISGINSRNSAFNWATGLNYTSYNKWQIRGLVATAFRSPNIDDFAKFREKNGFISVPNPELKPERALSTELTIAKTFGAIRTAGSRASGYSLTLSATAFYTRLENAIVRQNFQLPNGDPYLITQGDTLLVQANVNSDEAKIYGLSGNFSLNLSNKFKLQSSINYTKGSRKFMHLEHLENPLDHLMVPQDHIPPLYGQTRITYQTRRFKISAMLRYQGKKAADDYAVSGIFYDPTAGLIFDRTGSSDNIEYGLVDANRNFQGTYAWSTINLYSAYQFSDNLSFQIGLENIMNTHYRVFASGLSAPGRNLIFSIRGKI